MLFDMDFDGDVDVFDNVTEFMLANGELTGDEDSDDDDDCWDVIAARAHYADLNADGIAVLPADWDDDDE